MLKRIKKLLEKPEAVRASPGADELRLAAAALLVEAAHMDEEFDGDERGAASRALERRFDISTAEADALLGDGEAAQASATDLYQFAKAINEALAPEDRRQIIEMLWEVVYADGVLHPYEASLMRKLSGLLHVPDRDSAEVRQKVLAGIADKTVPTG